MDLSDNNLDKLECVTWHDVILLYLNLYLKGPLNASKWVNQTPLNHHCRRITLPHTMLCNTHVTSCHVTSRHVTSHLLVYLNLYLKGPFTASKWGYSNSPLLQTCHITSHHLT